MKVTIAPGPFTGTIAAIPSKSEAHRLLLCAALADKPTLLQCDGTSEDIEATVRCLRALGAEITRKGTDYLILPLHRETLPAHCDLYCGESGATLRFLLPVVGALGVTATFYMEGRLPQRPLYSLSQEMEFHGCHLLFAPEAGLLRISGKLHAGDYVLPGNVSSQFISGMLFGLPLLEENSWLTIVNAIESEPYIDMTVKTLNTFGVWPQSEETGWKIVRGEYCSPALATVEGDWSNSATWLCAGALPGGEVTVTGLNPNSLQGDRAVCEILKEMGAQVSWQGDGVTVRAQARRESAIDAREIPDLVPVLSAVVALGEGASQFTGAGRLRLKETNRLAAIEEILSALGGQITQSANGLMIHGRETLSGGTVDAQGDHRMAMMAALVSSACDSPVTITGAQAVKKSYPSFWEDLQKLGKTVTVAG